MGIRKTGYYWIKKHKESDWEPALYLNSYDAWEFIGDNKWESDVNEVKKDEFNREIYLKLPD